MFALLTSKQGKRRGDGTVWHISRHTRPRSSTRTDKADLCHDICNQTERRHTAAFLSVYDCKINLHTYTPTAACIVSGGLRESVSIPILQFFFIRNTLLFHCCIGIARKPQLRSSLTLRSSSDLNGSSFLFALLLRQTGRRR